MVARLFFFQTNIVMYQFLQQRSIRGQFVCLLFIVIHTAIFAQSGYVGETIYLTAPSVYGTIDNAAWTCPDRSDCVIASGNSYSGSAWIYNYFTGTATVRCHYGYHYIINGVRHNEIGQADYIITCKPSTVTLNKKEVTMKPGEKVNLTYTNSSGFELPTVEWTTSDKSVAGFPFYGISEKVYDQQTVTVQAVGSGNCTITCRGNFGGEAPVCIVHVVATPPTAISIPATAITRIGESVTLTPTLTPSDAYAKIAWSSSDESIAVVSDGRVTGKNVGKTTIMARTDNGLTATCEVTVQKTTVTVSTDAESGLYGTGKTVTLKASKTDADIYYTLDGNIPTTNSIRYSGPITLTKTVTLKAIATGSNYETSPVLTRQYQITSLTVKSSWSEAEKQTPYFIPSVIFNKSVNKYSNIGAVKLTQGDTDIDGQVLVQEGVLYYVPNSKLNMGSFTLSVPENAVIDGNGEPNMAFELNFVVGEGFEPAPIMAAAGYLSSYVIRSDNTLWYWVGSKVPTKFMDEVSTITVPPYFGNICIIKTDNTLWVGTDKIMDNVVQAVSGYEHILAVKSDGSLWTWGRNTYGQLGDGTTTERNSPVKIMDDVEQVSAGSFQSFAVKADGSLWAWGDNEIGTLGDKTYVNRRNPVKIMDEVAKVAAGVSSTYAIKTDGTLWSWGRNSDGELGIGRFSGTKKYHPTPSKVMDDVAEIAAGFHNVIAIKNDGSLWGCGENADGQLGDGTTVNRCSPVKIMEDVAQVSAGRRHTLAIKTDSTLWTWGTGALGDGSYVPLCIMGITQFSHVTCILLPGKKQMSLGGRCLLLPTVSPSNGCFESVSFESSNSDVVTVSLRGIVEAKAMGSATITMIVDGKYKATCDIEVKNREIEVAMPGAGYATFYSSESSYVLPPSLSAKVVTSISNNKLRYQLLSGNIIPKATAVMLTSEAKRAGTYTLSSSDMAESYSGTNLLRGSDEAQMTTGDGYHYKLSYGMSGTAWSDVFGWYWGADNGAPFMTEGHKAWLVVPKSAATTRGFTVDGETTGISTLEKSEEESVYYDLQGRRITKPTVKGVYIKNGKKVMIK